MLFACSIWSWETWEYLEANQALHRDRLQSWRMWIVYTMDDFEANVILTYLPSQRNLWHQEGLAYWQTLEQCNLWVDLHLIVCADFHGLPQVCFCRLNLQQRLLHRRYRSNASKVVEFYLDLLCPVGQNKNKLVIYIETKRNKIIHLFPHSPRPWSWCFCTRHSLH